MLVGVLKEMCTYFQIRKVNITPSNLNTVRSVLNKTQVTTATTLAACVVLATLLLENQHFSTYLVAHDGCRDKVHLVTAPASKDISGERSCPQPNGTQVMGAQREFKFFSSLYKAYGAESC